MSTWTYSQKTGEMRDPAGNLIATGYSGAPGYVNKPRAEWRENEGPLPTGDYTILSAYDHEALGPVAMPLEPAPSNKMHGRSGFFIHGDNTEGNQSASEGCIVFGREIREKINASETRELIVTV